MKQEQTYRCAEKKICEYSSSSITRYIYQPHFLYVKRSWNVVRMLLFAAEKYIFRTFS